MTQPHVERMKAELAELTERNQKLADFIESNPLFHQLPDLEAGLMQAQRGAMNAYRCVLGMRLAIAEGSLHG